MACYSGLTRVIRHPRSVSIRAFAVIRHVCRDAHAHARAHMLMQDARRHTPQQDARRHTPHSQLTRRTLGWQQQAGPTEGPGPRGARLLPCADETCERRAERCSTNYVVPLKRWQAFSCRATLPERVLCDFSCPPLTRLARFHWADLLVRRAL